MTEMVRRVALAICKSRTCEGVSCCQWPANTGRHSCNAKQGAYDEAAEAAIAAMREPTDGMLYVVPDHHAPVAYLSWKAMIDSAITTPAVTNGDGDRG